MGLFSLRSELPSNYFRLKIRPPTGGMNTWIRWMKPTNFPAAGRQINGLDSLGCRILVIFEGADFDFSFPYYFDVLSKFRAEIYMISYLAQYVCRRFCSCQSH